MDKTGHRRRAKFSPPGITSRVGEGQGEEVGRGEEGDGVGRQGWCETDGRECPWVENSFRCTGSQGQSCLLSAVAREMRWGHMMQITGLPPQS